MLAVNCVDELNEMYQKYAEFSSEKRYDVVRKCYDVIIKYYSERFDEEIAKEAFLRMFCLFSYVTYPPTVKHYNLYINVTDSVLSYQEFVDIAKEKKELKNGYYFKEFLYIGNEKVLKEIIVLCVCLFTIDGPISGIGKKYIESHFIE